MNKQEIPNHYHFIWIGSEKPYFLILAIESVLLRCADAEVILWTDNPEDDSEGMLLLSENSRFSVRKIVVEELFGALQPDIREKLSEIFAIAGTKSNIQNTRPIERSRSNLIRYLILYQFGGIYLDADTLVLQDLSPLRQASSAFLGKENSIWAIIRRHNPLHRFIWAPLLEVIRWIAVQLPAGYKMNKLYRIMCSSSENNAVMGLCAEHDYLDACFRFIASMDRTEIIRPLRLGPFLLQRLAQKHTFSDVITYPERYFYPYGPLISQHFFRKRSNAQKVADYMIDRETYVLHWGASTKFLKTYTRPVLEQLGASSVFSLLANQVITEYETNYSR